MPIPPALPLRVATPADAAAIAELTRRAYSPWVEVIGREPLPMTVNYHRAVAEHRFELLERQGRLTALIETEPRPDSLYIVNIAVDPALHGQGLGQALLAHAEALAHAAGYAEVTLATNALMARNIALYRRVGYAIEREDHAPNGVAVLMRKAIARRLVFLPGAGASGQFWRPLGDRLPHHWEKTYLSWPGLGDEPPDPSVEGVDDLVRLVDAAVGAEPADLLAQSMGVVIALRFALQHKDRVRRLVLAAGSGGVDAAFRARSLHDWRETYRRQYPNAAPWIGEDRTDLTERLSEVAAPTLLIFGAADPIAPPFVGERLAELLPRASLQVLRGGEHDLAQSRAKEAADLAYEHLR